jgi:hypothetical protein
VKRAEALVVIGFAVLGLVWSWAGHVYDLRSAPGRMLVTLVGFAVCSVAMWAGLAVARVPPAARARWAVRAVLPWNGLLLSQIAYVGYFFIPLEALACVLLLRGGRAAGMPSLGAAITLALLTRGMGFLVTLALASAVRSWFPA